MLAPCTVKVIPIRLPKMFLRIPKTGVDFGHDDGLRPGTQRPAAFSPPYSAIRPAARGATRMHTIQPAAVV